MTDILIDKTFSFSEAPKGEYMIPKSVVMIIFITLMLSIRSTGINASNGSTANHPKKLALLVGINKYRWSNNSAFKNLRGSINDVRAVRHLLINRFDFLSNNIKVLTDEQATRQAILDSFNSSLVSQAKAGDVVLFYYSGHGSRMVDISGDEADGYDETIVPYDSRDPNGRVFDITDDEVRVLLLKLYKKGVYAMVFFDSCHSGSAARLGKSTAQARWVPIDTRRPAMTDSAIVHKTGDGRKGFFPDLSHYIAIAATTDESKAYEMQKGKNFYGAFSLALTNALGNLPQNVTYRELMTNIRNQMQSIMSIQIPQFEGDIYGKLFNGIIGAKQPVIEASYVDETRVELLAGSVQIMTKGSEFNLFKFGKGSSDDVNDLLGKAIVEAVYTDTSLAQVVERKANFDKADAVEVAHNYGELKVVVLIDSSDNPDYTRLIDRIKQMPVVKTVKDGYYDVRIYEKDDFVRMERYDGSKLAEDVSLQDKEKLTKFIKMIQRQAKFQAITDLANRNSKLAIKIDVFKKERDSSGVMREIPLKNVAQNGEVILHPDERIFFEVKNVSPYGQDYYVYVLYMGMDYEVQLIYPPPGAKSNLLKNGKKIRTGTGKVEKKIDRRDMIKVIATSSPVNVAILQQPGIDKSAFRSPLSELEQLLFDVMTGSRDSKDAPLPLKDWGTNSIATYTIKE